MDFERLIWIVPIAVAAVGAWRPRYGLVLLAASLPLFGSPPGGPYLAALDVAAVAAIGVSLLAIRRRFPGEEDWRHSGMEWPVAAWVAVSLISCLPLVFHPPAWTANALGVVVRALPGVQSGFPFYTWRAVANLLIGFGLYWAVRRAFAGHPLRPLGRGVAVGVGALVVLGLGELAGLISLDGYRAIGAPLYDARLHSLFFHSGWLSQYLVMALPFAAASLLTGGRWSRVAGVSLLAGGLLTILFTMQRGAWLVALAQLCFLPLLLRPGHGRRLMFRWIAAGLVIVLLTGGLTVAFLQPELSRPLLERVTENVTLLSGRPTIWRGALELARERPLLGWGLGAFATAYDQIHPPGSEGAWQYRGTAHSLYFQTLAERGLIGLLALFAVGWALRRGLGEASAVKTGDRFAMSVGLLLALVGIAIYGIVQYPFYLKNSEFLAWLLLGAGSLMMAGAPPNSARRLAQAVLLVALLLAPWRWVKAEPPSSELDRMVGFHEVKKAGSAVSRWTEGDALWAIPWKGRILHLRLVDGHPRASSRSVEVVIRADGREVWRGEAPRRWTVIDLDIGAPTAERLALGIEARPTFRPFSDYRGDPELPPSRDIRELGVVVSDLYWDNQRP